MSQYQEAPLDGGCLPFLEAPIGKMETYSSNGLLGLWGLIGIALL